MDVKYFEEQTLIEFIKREFRNRKNRKGFLNNFVAFFQLLLLSILNYKNQKEWSQQFRIIEKQIQEIYLDVKCTNINEKMTISTIFKMLKSSRSLDTVHFNFDKVHLIITSNTMFFFPYRTLDRTTGGLHYNLLENSFRIRFNQNDQRVKNNASNELEFVSIENKIENTIITFKTEELGTDYKLILNRKITIPNYT